MPVLPLCCGRQPTFWNSGILTDRQKSPLQARSLAELIGLQQKCEAWALVHALISDAGRTELPTGTVTAVAIGPADDKLVDRVSGSAPLL